MNNYMKLFLPLIQGLWKEDFTKEAGFVDAFTNDINSPDENNYIYLMYTVCNEFQDYNRTYYKIRKLRNFHSSKTYKIGNHVYIIYKLIANVNSLKSLLKGVIQLNTLDIIRILQFWGYNDDYVNSIVLNTNVKFESNCVVNIPEVDFQTNCSLIDMFAVGLVINENSPTTIEIP